MTFKHCLSISKQNIKKRRLLHSTVEKDLHILNILHFHKRNKVSNFCLFVKSHLHMYHNFHFQLTAMSKRDLVSVPLAAMLISKWIHSCSVYI